MRRGLALLIIAGLFGPIAASIAAAPSAACRTHGKHCRQRCHGPGLIGDAKAPACHEPAASRKASDGPGFAAACSCRGNGDSWLNGKPALIEPEQRLQGVEVRQPISCAFAAELPGYPPHVTHPPPAQATS